MDPRYEFEAPKFVDFTKLGTSDEEDHAVDSFFDTDMERCNGKIAETFEEEIGVTVEESRTTTTVVTEATTTIESTSEDNTKRAPPKNLVTSWGNTKVLRSNSLKTKQISTSESNPVEEMRKRLRQDTPSRKMRREAVNNTINNIKNSPLMKPKRLGTNQMTPRLNSQVEQHKQVGRLRTTSKSPGHNLPRTPEAMRRFKNKMAAGVTQNQADIKIKSAASAGPSKSNNPVKATAKAPVKGIGLTQTKEFTFATDSRLKSSGSRRRSVSVPDAPNFIQMLRKPSAGSAEKNSGPLKLTKPQPFPRVEGQKRKHSDGEEFKSMAEQVNKYQRGTPDRFRSKPRGRSQSPMRLRLRSQSPRGCTIPQSPALTTKGRSRPHHILSQSEREELEMEEAKKNQFHAKSVGQTVPKYKHPEIEQRACTVPQPFQVASKLFSKPAPPPEQKVENFQSKPVNKKILEGPIGVPAKKVVPAIEPESPAFKLKERLAARKPVEVAPTEPERIPRARPVPHYGVPVQLPPVSKRSTVPAPFSFSDRDDQLAQKKEEKIKKILEEEKAAREFHANPILKEVANPRLPEKKVQPPTQIAPFQLKIEERVETRLNKWQEDIKKELDDQRKAANFKANEPKVLHQAPFVPKPSDRQLSEISNFTLHSDRRAVERQAYEKERLKKELDIEQAKREKEERKKREQAEEVTKLRRQAVHKAQPIKGYKALQIKPSEKPLTRPTSPRLTSRVRSNSTFSRGNSTFNHTQNSI